jgi:hypothetical protein
VAAAPLAAGVGAAGVVPHIGAPAAAAAQATPAAVTLTHDHMQVAWPTAAAGISSVTSLYERDDTKGVTVSSGRITVRREADARMFRVTTPDGGYTLFAPAAGTDAAQDVGIGYAHSPSRTLVAWNPLAWPARSTFLLDGAPVAIDLTAGFVPLQDDLTGSMVELRQGFSAEILAFGKRLQDALPPMSTPADLAALDPADLAALDAALLTAPSQTREISHTSVLGIVPTPARLSDASPHYGAARIRTAVGSCTSGFVVANGTGRWATTASHCFDEWTPNGNGINVASDFHNYGRSTAFSANDPDVAMIGTNTETYTNYIYTDPGTPSTRPVTGKHRTPPASYCLSGSFTRSVCGAVLIDASDELCGSTPTTWGSVTRCYNNLVYVEHPTASVVIAQGGDSGGPAYGRPNATDADARGSIVAGRGSGGNYAWLHNIGTIENWTGASIATTCCAARSY